MDFPVRWDEKRLGWAAGMDGGIDMVGPAAEFADKPARLIPLLDHQHLLPCFGQESACGQAAQASPNHNNIIRIM